jgi:hypothetical protein
VLARTNGDNVRVVVLPSQNRRVHTPHQSSPGATDLVGSNLLAIARCPKYNPQGVNAGGLVTDHRSRRGDAETGVVIDRVEFNGAVIDDLVALVAQVIRQIATKLKSCMVCGNVDSH